MFGKKTGSSFWTGKAREASEEAQSARDRAAKLRRGLGRSTDPAADRYMIRQAEEDARIHEANARDWRRLK